jgi:hypothetical protein
MVDLLMGWSPDEKLGLDLIIMTYVAFVTLTSTYYHTSCDVEISFCLTN